jgi:hypothetical protein
VRRLAQATSIDTVVVWAHTPMKGASSYKAAVTWLLRPPQCHMAAARTSGYDMTSLVIAAWGEKL